MSQDILIGNAMVRHVWLRRFYSKLDILLNEDVLIGRSRACQETLRQPAASTLAELIVHVRADLTLQQIQRIVYMFSRWVCKKVLSLTHQAELHSAHHCKSSQCLFYWLRFRLKF